MNIRKLLISLSVLLLTPLSAYAVAGVSGSDLQNSANIILPSGSAMERLEGYNSFSLASQYSLDGGIAARYEARIQEDPWEDSEIVHLKLLNVAYQSQDVAQQQFRTLVSSMASQHEVIYSDERELYFRSDEIGTADAFGSVSAEYDSLHLLHVNGNIIYQASVYKTSRTYESDYLAIFENMIADEEAVYDVMAETIQSNKVALALLFPPDSADLTTKTERSSLDLTEVYDVPLNGSVDFDLYVGEIDGAVGTILDSSGLGTAVDGDLYLYIHNDGRLFAGIYAPEYDADCVQQAGWYRIQSVGVLHPYEWNSVHFNFGVEGFELELNGVSSSCSMAQPRSDASLYFGDLPGDGIDQSMIGYVDNVDISYASTSTGYVWDTLLETQLYADLSNLDADLAVFQYMKDQGIFVGSEGYLYPDAALNRAQMLKVLLKAFGYTVGTNSSSRFADVPSDSWYAPYVVVAEGIGMVQGNSDGSFAPAAEINRAEFYTMLQRLAGVTPLYVDSYYDVSSSDWYSTAAAYAAATGLVTDAYFGPTEVVTRREAARILYTLLQ